MTRSFPASAFNRGAADYAQVKQKEFAIIARWYTILCRLLCMLFTRVPRSTKRELVLIKLIMSWRGIFTWCIWKDWSCPMARRICARAWWSHGERPRFSAAAKWFRSRACRSAPTITSPRKHGNFAAGTGNARFNWTIRDTISFVNASTECLE